MILVIKKEDKPVSLNKEINEVFKQFYRNYVHLKSVQTKKKWLFSFLISLYSKSRAAYVELLDCPITEAEIRVTVSYMKTEALT